MITLHADSDIDRFFEEAADILRIYSAFPADIRRPPLVNIRCSWAGHESVDGGEIIASFPCIGVEWIELRMRTSHLPTLQEADDIARRMGWTVISQLSPPEK